MKSNKKILSPKIDIVFKMLFGEQKHERITKKLIEDVIEEKIDTIELEQTPYLLGMQPDDKIGIVDIRATINNKNPIDIEMQILDNHDIEKRILFYWSKLYSNQIDRGEEYEKLNRCICIIFLDYEIKKLENLPTHTKWQILNSKNGKTLLTEDLEIHIIEIPKIDKMLETGKLKKWIMFLENPDGEETKKMAEKEEEIKEAIETLEEISSDEQKERIAELRQKYIMDKKSEIKTAVEKGLEQGERKAKVQFVSRLIKNNVDIDIIVDALGTNKEEIEDILNEININEQKERIAELRQKYIMDKKSEMRTALEQGLEQGARKAKIEIAKKMLKERLDIELIEKITGLTGKEINEL